MQSALRLEVARSFEPLAVEWEELAAKTGASPFVHPGWMEAWWGSFGQGSLRILAARRAEVLVAVLPIQLRRGIARTLTNEHTPAFDVVGRDEEATRAFARTLFEGGVRSFEFQRLDATSETLAVVENEGRAARYRGVVGPVARSPYIPCARTLAEHRRTISHNLRHDVERRFRRLREQGAVSVEVADGSQQLAELLAEGFHVEELSWKGRRGTAIASDERTRRFYEAVARWAAKRGWLRLAFLRLDGRALAFQFDLEAGTTYYSLKIGYDPTFVRYSPGKLLAYAMVERAVESGLASYELLGTNEPWKDRWTTAFRDYVRLDEYAPSPGGIARRALVTQGRRIARGLPWTARLRALRGR